MFTKQWRRTSQQKYLPFSSKYMGPLRRHSCHCDECGILSQFQKIHQNNGWVPLHVQKEKSQQVLISQQESSEDFPVFSKNGKTMSTSMSFTLSHIDKVGHRKRRNSCTCSECGLPTEFQLKNQDVPLTIMRKKPKLFIIRKKTNNLKYSRTMQIEKYQMKSRIDPLTLIEQKKQQYMSQRHLDHRRNKTEYMSQSNIALPAVTLFSSKQISRAKKLI